MIDKIEKGDVGEVDGDIKRGEGVGLIRADLHELVQDIEGFFVKHRLIDIVQRAEMNFALFDFGLDFVAHLIPF